MADTHEDEFRNALTALDAADPRFATDVVELALRLAREAEASDVHLLPTPDGLEMRWRVDGVLRPVAMLPARLGPNVVARLKVMSDLLTYRTEVPQEGRIRGEAGEVEVRVSTFPSLHGEKAVVRMFAAAGRYNTLDDLGLPAEILAAMRRLLAETSGAILLAGPAGSGKTTTLYACLRELVGHGGGGRSLATLEDPVEVAVAGVAQSQVNEAAGFTLELGLRSLLRQDPEVIAVGEVRDRTTAEVAFQASLTGHLVLTTFHAGNAAGVLGRLADMGIEPYLLRSGVLAVLCQRLARRLCDCAISCEHPAARLGLPVSQCREPVGCPLCGGTGYRGRLMLAELLLPDMGDVGASILRREDVAKIEAAALAGGMVGRWRRAIDAVEEGITSPAEIRRVLGVGEPVLEPS
ncbi:GspE/PulE family protein [Isosphaeraceae bacterium EP7]